MAKDFLKAILEAEENCRNKENEAKKKAEERKISARTDSEKCISDAKKDVEKMLEDDKKAVSKSIDIRLKKEAEKSYDRYCRCSRSVCPRSCIFLL